MTTHKKRAKARKKSVKQLKLLIRTAHEKRITDAAYLRGLADGAYKVVGEIMGSVLAIHKLSNAISGKARHRRLAEQALEMGFPAVPMSRPAFTPGGHTITGSLFDEPEMLKNAVASKYYDALDMFPKVWSYTREPGEPFVKPVGSPVELKLATVGAGRMTILEQRLAEIRAKQGTESAATAKPVVCIRCNDAGQVVDGNAIPASHREPLKYKPCPDCVFMGRVIVVPRGSGVCGSGCGCFNQCELKNPNASTLPANARVFIRDEYK